MRIAQGMLLLLAGAALVWYFLTDTPSGLHDGKPAPDIHGVDADGQSFQLRDYRGKVVLLDFWASY